MRGTRLFFLPAVLFALGNQKALGKGFVNPRPFPTWGRQWADQIARGWRSTRWQARGNSIEAKTAKSELPRRTEGGERRDRTAWTVTPGTGRFQ